MQELPGQDWGTKETWKESELPELVVFDDMSLLTVIFHDVEVEILAEHSETIDSTFAEFRDSNRKSTLETSLGFVVQRQSAIVDMRNSCLRNRFSPPGSSRWVYVC